MKKYFFLFVLCFTIFIIHLIAIRHGIYGDGNGYYAFTQAIYFDKGLNFGPINNFLGNFHGVKGDFSRFFWDSRFDPYQIGTGIIWIPSVAIISIFFRDRFSMVFEMGPGITGILLVLGGLYFAERYLQNFFSKKVASLSVLFFFFASNLFYYSSFEPALSHQPSFFIIAFLLYKSYKFSKKSINYFLFGALTGLLYITRASDIIFLIPIYWQILKSSPSVKNWAVLVLSTVLFLLPLFWSNSIMYQNPFHMSYIEDGINQLNLSVTRVIEFFLSARRGLFTWTPIYIFAFVGLIKSHKWLFLVSITLLILLCAAGLGPSVEFGQRFVIGGIPYFAYGMASFIERINIKKTAVLFVLLLIWNLLTIFHFYTDKPNLIHNDNLTLTMFVEGQFESPVNAIVTIKNKGLNYFFYKKVLY